MKSRVREGHHRGLDYDPWDEEGLRILRRVCLGAILIAVLGVPLLLCVVYATFRLGSIGPWIPLTAVINVVILPLLAGAAALGLVRKKWLNVLVVSVAVLLGALLAVLGMNAFIWLTWVFGLFDYALG